MNRTPLALFALALAVLWTPLLATPTEDATALMEARDYQKARTLLEGALDGSATKGDALVLLTRACNALGDYEAGTKYGQQAIETLPDSSDAHLEYARALAIKMQRINKMKAMFTVGSYKSALRKALELEPESVEARIEEIGFFIHAPGIAGGSTTKARERIRELEALDWREAMFMQAELHQKEKDTAAMVRTYEAMLERNADDLQARQGLGFALQSNEQYRDADRHFGKLLDSDDPRRALTARYQLARSRILGRYDQDSAVKYLLEYIEQLSDSSQGLPTSSHAHWRLGLAYQQLDRIAEARQALEKAVALDAENKQAKAALKSLPKG